MHSRAPILRPVEEKRSLGRTSPPREPGERAKPMSPLSPIPPIPPIHSAHSATVTPVTSDERAAAAGERRRSSPPGFERASSVERLDGRLRLALAGGGTGGHIVPGLHLVRYAFESASGLEDLLWFQSGRPVAASKGR